MFVAVVGCCHGELDIIYDTLAEAEKHASRKVDLLLICGDFQAVRNEDDLECLACPPKYRRMNTFFEYYSGEKRAPVPTIFVGGNHEASNYMQELPYGGLVAPGIYYMGYAGVVSVGGLRIGGLSGIYDRRDYNAAHFEAPPYTESSLRTVYHARREEVEKLLRLRKPLDVFLSHDWPSQITKHGNLHKLLQRKGFLRDDIANNKLGSPALDQLLHELKPRYFFAAHLHAKFPALVHHEGGATTRFLSLSKPLPGQDFLQVLEIVGADGPADNQEFTITRDPEWLAIIKNPDGGEVGPEDLEDVVRLMGGPEGLQVAESDFHRTGRCYDPQNPVRGQRPAALSENKQTLQLVNKLQLRAPTAPATATKRKMALPAPVNSTVVQEPNPEEIALDSASEEDPPADQTSPAGGEDQQTLQLENKLQLRAPTAPATATKRKMVLPAPVNSTAVQEPNPEEIALDSESGEDPPADQTNPTAGEDEQTEPPG